MLPKLVLRIEQVLPYCYFLKPLNQTKVHKMLQFVTVAKQLNYKIESN